jgi:hypothetical protein
VTESGQWTLKSDLKFWEGVHLEAGGFRLVDGVCYGGVGSTFNGLTGFPDLPCAMRAAYFHDWLLKEGHERWPSLDWPAAYLKCHKVFRDILRVDAPRPVAWALYKGVRIFHPLTLD